MRRLWMTVRGLLGCGPMTLSALVKQHREDQGLTIAEASAVVGMSATGLKEIENTEWGAKPNPKRHTLRKLVLGLGLHPAEVLGICPECRIDVEGEVEHRMDCMTGAVERREERDR